MLVGQGPDETSLGLGRLYLLITLGILAVSLNQIRDVFTLRRWRTGLAQGTSGGRGAFRRVVLSIGGEIAWPLFLLLGLPWILGLSLSELVLWMPDVGYWTIAVVLIGLGVGLIEARLAFVTLRRRGQRSKRGRQRIIRRSSHARCDENSTSTS